MGLLGVAAACRGDDQKSSAPPPPSTPGAPPTFGALPEVGPAVSPTTFAEAEKLVQVQMTDAERTMAATTWRRSMAMAAAVAPEAAGPAAPSARRVGRRDSPEERFRRGHV